MSQRKILFFVIVGVVLVSVVITINIIGKKKPQIETPKALTIWIDEGTTEAYKDIIDGFKKYAPEYAKTTITFEKKTSDPVQYRTLLLNTFSDGKGPDIFMLDGWEDIVLEWKIEPIPSNIISLKDFDKKYEDIFLPLIISSWSVKDQTEYLMGVPMGYETLGVFYNKSLVRTVPKTWNELDTLYNDWLATWKYPSNLGLSPRYTPNMSDIMALFLGNQNMLSYKNLLSAGSAFISYMHYGTLSIGANVNSGGDVYAIKTTLSSATSQMDTDKSTTLDMFMQWDIGMVFWFPSLVEELEKAYKRAGDNAVNDIILTERIPKDSLSGKNKNLAHYTYFWVSKTTTNEIASAKFLEYLMTKDAEQKFLNTHPYLIAAQREFYTAQGNTQLSSVLSHTRLDAFIPETDETLFVFDYGLKSEFDTFLDKYIDNNNTWDISNVWQSLSHTILCAVAPYTQWDIPSDCEKKE